MQSVNVLTHGIFVLFHLSHMFHKKPPILRTVNIQRISPLGIDFIMKQGTRAAHISTLPIAVCVTSGSYSPGEQVEQWRAEGRCSAIPLQEIIDVSPSSTIAQMIASTRAANEAAADEAQVGWRKICSKDRLVIQRKSRFVEMVQEARLELANGEISMDEIKEAVQVRLMRNVCVCGAREVDFWACFTFLLMIICASYNSVTVVIALNILYVLNIGLSF
uniref:Uncharacterized protein n=1 Tax=Corethron hystrix TaxID=216773 RepID=A0A7S1FZH3_9STRA|mmetsp:Transcript_41277/g.96798  ORF Transcript_41277/g.96798 Transcript_41277/m.96798 type:complete len:219 (+) Transcript_41277:569-1225(+)